MVIPCFVLDVSTKLADDVEAVLLPEAPSEYELFELDVPSGFMVDLLLPELDSLPLSELDEDFVL